MATKIISSPSKYVQGPGELGKLENYSRNFGEKPFIIADSFVMNMTKDTIKESYAATNTEFIPELFNGECSKNEV